MKNCKSCNHSRKAKAEGYVCCTFYKDPIDLGDAINNDVYEGWADLGARPHHKEGSGLLSNCCYIIDENSLCKKHNEFHL